MLLSWRIGKSVDAKMNEHELKFWHRLKDVIDDYEVTTETTSRAVSVAHDILWAWHILFNAKDGTYRKLWKEPWRRYQV